MLERSCRPSTCFGCCICLQFPPPVTFRVPILWLRVLEDSGTSRSSGQHAVERFSGDPLKQEACIPQEASPCSEGSGGWRLILDVSPLSNSVQLSKFKNGDMFSIDLTMRKTNVRCDCNEQKKTGFQFMSDSSRSHGTEENTFQHP